MKDEKKIGKGEPESSIPRAKESMRDNKGRFIPKNKNTHNRKDKNPSIKKDIDENTVKIRIIKEKKPLPPKEFEGKLEDEKDSPKVIEIRETNRAFFISYTF